MFRIQIALLLALGACSVADRPERVVETRPFAGQAPRGPALLKSAMETGHRDARRQVGVPPLAWDDALAVDAKRYADELARTGRFEHSPQPRGIPNQGENLWTGTRGAYRYAEMIGHWNAERKDYVPGVLPNVTRTGRFGDVSHYTQITWRATQRYGCAEAHNTRDDFVVCRYLPAGNVAGEVAF